MAFMDSVMPVIVIVILFGTWRILHSDAPVVPMFSVGSIDSAKYSAYQRQHAVTNISMADFIRSYRKT